jgi:glycine cleavage system H protein
MSMEHHEAIVDKFVFRVAADCRYSEADVWARRVGDHVRIGLTDYLQQRSGDVASVTLKQVGTAVKAGDELGALDTIKVDLVVPAPLAGTIVAINDALGEHPELVNSDPYGAGWLADIVPSDWAEFDALSDAETYLPQMAARAELERGR